MWGRIKEVIKENQPISYTGIPRHIALWMTSGFGDIVYENPNFNGNDANRIDIYCVHGTADRSASFSLVARRLIREVPDNVASIRLVSFEGRAQGNGIHYFASQLVAKIQANQHSNVMLMGHSRGGVVVALADILATEKGIKVHAVFPISAPFEDRKSVV